MKVPKSKDYDVRAACVTQLLKEGYDRRDIRHEITLDTSSSGGRCDLVVLSDTEIAGMEIKSGSDVLLRLADQKTAMKRAFDKQFIVMDKLHYDENSPYYDYIYYCHEQKSLGEIHGGKFGARVADSVFKRPHWYGNQSYRTSHLDMLHLLWADEVVEIAKQFDCKKKTRCSAIPWLKENAPLKDLRPKVIHALRNRVVSRWDEAFWKRYDAEVRP